MQARNGAGFVAFLNDTLENLGRVKTSGWDFTLNWLGPQTDWGRPGANWQTTYVDKYSAVDTSTGEAEPQGPGVEVTDSGIPRVRSTLRLDWQVGAFDLGYSFRYLSRLTEDCASAAGFAVCNGPVSAANAERFAQARFGHLSGRARRVEGAGLAAADRLRRHQQRVGQGSAGVRLVLAQRLRRLELRSAGPLLVRGSEPEVLIADQSNESKGRLVRPFFLPGIRCL